MLIVRENERLIHSDDGVTVETPAIVSRDGGHLTLSTELIRAKFWVVIT